MFLMGARTARPAQRVSPTHRSRKGGTGQHVGCLGEGLPRQAAVLSRSGLVGGAWSVMENGPGNRAADTTGQLAAAMRHQLDRIQRRPALISGFLGQTGIAIEPQPP